MKVVVLTHSLGTNYGGLLQAFALQKTLSNMGHDVKTAKYSVKNNICFIGKVCCSFYYLFRRYICGNKEYNPYVFFFRKNNSILNRITINADRFIDSHIKSIDFFGWKTKPSKSMISNFDAIVVGSDQVWRPKYVYTPTYFLYFSKNVKVRRIAYAASFGVDNMNEFKSDVLKKCRVSALKFDAVSVREDSAVRMCKEYFNINALHVLDPTMLLDKEDYLKVIEDKDKQERSNILMAYVLDKSEEKRRVIDLVANRLGLNELSVMPRICYPEITNNENDWVYPSVSEWIAGFRDAKFIVTDSFHGTVFSIIFNKPFIVIDNKSRGSDRFISLLRIFELEDRLIDIQSNLDDSLFAPMDYSKVNKIWLLWKNKSKEFLVNSLS